MPLHLRYTVQSGVRLTHGVLGFCFTVVSAKFPSEHCDARVEAFIQSFYDTKCVCIRHQCVHAQTQGGRFF